MGDEVLRQFILDSDQEVQDSPNARRSQGTFERSICRDADFIDIANSQPKVLNNNNRTCNRQAATAKRAMLNKSHPIPSVSAAGGVRGRMNVQSHKNLQTAESSRTTSGPKSSIPKHCPQPPTFTTVPGIAAPPPHAKKTQVKRRPPLPATEPDTRGHYEASSCHQCRTKTTRTENDLRSIIQPKLCCSNMSPLFNGSACLRRHAQASGPTIPIPTRRENPLHEMQEYLSLHYVSEGAGRVEKEPIVGNQDTRTPAEAQKRKNRQQEAGLDEVICLEKSWAELSSKRERITSADRSIPGSGSSKIDVNLDILFKHTGKRASTVRDSSDLDREPGCSRKRKLCAEQLTEIDSNCGEDDSPITMDRPIKSEKSIKSERPIKSESAPESPASMASITHIKLQLWELELEKAREEHARKIASADAEAKANMMQEFLRCGLTLEDAVKATEICLCPATRPQS
ncbi:hypothetical protein PTTG_12494 [Puccinia triticina 1-1 BBBD Race 1]|uniref:Uncharacterized protein n=1 Tax=Puccinia triticina (isolate 1-1 / race 1 (BBBD)) TaxID=630390 RepID=A0A180GWN5_PUCT1|nr:hypothetical protein PTTG_12494 [Puccinia triticina 1-1 BBBD Race 1]